MKTETAIGITKLNPALSAIPVIIAAILLKSLVPYAMWILYSVALSKLTGANLIQTLKDDGKTYSAAAVLLLLPLARLITVPEQFARFSYLPSAIIITAALSVFIALKTYFLPLAITAKVRLAWLSFTDRNSGKILLTAAVAYAALFSALSVAKHYAFNTMGIDLGIFDQTLWGLANGQAIFSTVVGDYLFAYHSFFLFYPLALVYKVMPKVELLLVLQSAVLGLGAIPLYRFAVKKLGKGLAATVAILYLLYPALNYINLEDFHIETFAVTTVLFSLYFLEQRKSLLFLLMVGITALIKEDTAITAATVGLYAVIVKRQIKTGLIAITIAAIIFIAATKLFIPNFSQTGSFQTGGFGALGNTPTEIVKSLVTDPLSIAAMLIKTEKLAYLAMLLLPVGALPLLAPELLAGAAPALAINLLSETPARSAIFFHYNANIIPFIFLALAIGLARVQKFAERLPKQLNPQQAKAAAISLVVSLAVLSAYFYGPLPGAKNFSFSDYDFNSERAKAARELAAMIPPDASVSAADTAVPHLSQRELVYVFPNPFHKAWYLSDARRNVTIEYVLLDLFDKQKEGIMTQEEYSLYANEILGSADYSILAYEGGWVLLKQGAETENGKLCGLMRSYDESRGTVKFLNRTGKSCKTGS